MKSINEQHIDLIERYLYGDMSQEEMQELNKLLQSDTEFNKLFHDMDHLIEGVRRSARQTTVDEKLARLEQALPFSMTVNEEDEQQNIFRRWFETINHYLDNLIARLFNIDREELTAIPINSRGQASMITLTGRIKLVAASAMIMIFLAATILYTQFTSVSLPELYASNFSVDRIEVTNYRSGDIEQPKGNLLPEQILDQANREFNRSNFGMAIDLIESVPMEQRLPGMNYCGALSYMKIERFNEAEELLARLGEVDDIVWKERSNWFLALCSMRQEHREEAISYLENVASIGGVYQEDAVALLKKLNR